jgi:hypothetical protein
MCSGQHRLFYLPKVCSLIFYELAYAQLNFIYLLFMQVLSYLGIKSDKEKLY